MKTLRKQFGKIALSAVASFAVMILTSFVAIPVQAQITLGTISGNVTDDEGALVSDVTITLKNQDTGISQSTRTDSKGVFTLRVAPGGNYTLTAELAPFQKVTAKKLSIPLGKTTTLDIKLPIGPITVI